MKGGIQARGALDLPWGSIKTRTAPTHAAGFPGAPRSLEVQVASHHDPLAHGTVTQIDTHHVVAAPLCHAPILIVSGAPLLVSLDVP
jgi:hypothetical protein